MNTRFYNARLLILKDDNPGSPRYAVEDGELWTEGSDIIYAGPAADTQSVFEELGRDIIVWDREIDAGGNLLMPGLKNAHSHLAMVMMRSLAEDLPLQEWLTEKIFPMEACFTPECVYKADILGIMECLAAGITSSFDMYYFPETNARAATDCGFRLSQVQGINDFGPSPEAMDENFEKINDMGGLVNFFIGCHAEYTTSLSLLERIAESAHRFKSPFFTHNSETKRETDECRKRHGISPTQLFDRLGLFDFGGGGYHCVYFDDEDIRIFREKGLTAVSCPASNLKLASGIAPLKKFVDAGLNIALGTDGAASNNRLDLFREMFLASTLAKTVEKDAECISTDSIIHMATAGGAYACGIPECDRIAPGKKADIIMIDLHCPNMQPENDIKGNLVYSCGPMNVRLTMINGKILYEDGKYSIGAEPGDVYRDLNEMLAKIRI